MRVCVFNGKGGVGKTMLSLNLAGYFAQQDPQARVLVADCDPNGSSLGWAGLAEETPFTVGRSRSRGFDVELLDMPPRLPENGVLPQADLFLVPTMLDGASQVMFRRTVELLKEQGKPFLVVANRVNRKRAEHRDRLESPELKGVLEIQDRAALSSYYALGLTVFDMPGRHVPAARAEVEAVARAVATYPTERAR